MSRRRGQNAVFHRRAFPTEFFLAILGKPQISIQADPRNSQRRKVAECRPTDDQVLVSELWTGARALPELGEGGDEASTRGALTGPRMVITQPPEGRAS